ncbi:nuclease-related domain-containing protein [Neobacillus sp. NPDC058068]|uniref:nuclease-related domain-containing protein n=1 Tax=Neobacillus sp. NPDC058068 TaxID=3346325 RepID=UPI0036DDE124
MAYKPRSEREELTIFRILNRSMNLSEEDQWTYFRLNKGFEGELMFDSLTEKIKSECLILNDLLLELNNSKFQIDSCIIQDSIYLFDVKNFEGDYCYEKGDLMSMKTSKLMQNPLDQLNRCETLFRQLLQKYGYKLPVEARLVFINPDFTLYQAPKDKPIIYPTQLNILMKKLNTWTGKINGKHKKLADLLISLHQVESPYPRVPRFEYEGLQKGLTSSCCHSFSVSVNGRKLVCDDCGSVEEIDAAVLRRVGELKLLFTGRKITTNGVWEWCGGICSKKTIKRILKNNFITMGKKKYTYFV